MANSDAPSGLKPVRHRDGTPYAGQTNLYYIPAADATAVWIGDAVSHGGSAGAAGAQVNGVDIEGMPAVKQTVAGDSSIVGVVVGFYPRPTALETNHRPASTEMIVMVADDPNLVYEIQEDSVGGNVAAASVGTNFDLIVAAGDSTSGQSAMELDSSTTVTTTANLRLERLVKRPGNIVGTWAKWEVVILEHFLRTPTGV